MATNGNINHVEQQYTSSSGEPARPTPSTSDSNTNSSKGELPKDEVGWYFVEQYYTTLSKTPEKLHVCQSSHLGCKKNFKLTSASCTMESGPSSSKATKQKSLP